MIKQIAILGALCLAGAAGLSGCHREQRHDPPPDAQRPRIKTESELSEQRRERIDSGAVVANSSPVLEQPEPPRVRRKQLPPTRPGPGAIEADILIIDDIVLTSSEVLYLARHRIAELRAAHTPAGFQERLHTVVRRTTQQEIGTLLVYSEALSEVAEEQKKMLDAAIDKRLDDTLTHDFGGSTAKLEAHLAQFGLTKDRFRDLVGRSMVVQQYSREKLMPRITVRRGELMEHFRGNSEKYSTPATRELLMIELPFEAFLPEGRTWDAASRSQRGQAKLKAMRRARAAHAALAENSFEEVSKEYSRGPHADAGGSWGQIGRPLQPPLDTPSKLIFEYRQGRYSDPVETDSGWYIVECGQVQPASRRTFAEVQDEIRRELMEQRFARLSVDYVMSLAEKATISSLDTFIATTVERAQQKPLVSAAE